MKGIGEIVEGVEAQLRLKSSGVDARRAKVSKLAKIRSAWIRPGGVLRERDDAVFTVDQARMMKMDRHLCLKLLVRGHHVADVALDHDTERLELTPIPKVIAANRITPPPNRPLAWSHDPDDGRAIRAFIRDCVKKLSGKTPELQVQLQLLRLLDGPKKQAALANLRPVMPFGFPTEIATVVGRQGNAVSDTGKPVTGNMDILARTVRGARRAGGNFVVLELKQPNLSKNEVAKAFEQAVGYAAALRYEANDPNDPCVAASYRHLYGPKPKSSRPPNYDGLPVATHAVVVLPIDRKTEAAACLTALGQHPSIQVGVLLYGASNRGNEWLLDDGSLGWLGWQP